MGNMKDTQRSEIVFTKQQRIAQIARQHPKERLTTLSHYLDIPWLEEAFQRVRKDSAPGVDGQTVADYGKHLEINLPDLLSRAKSGSFKAPPVKRVHIPKGEDTTETRPIGIPATESKVLERAVVMILEPIYKEEFRDFSYGFRPKRSCHQALAAFWDQASGMGIQWVLEVDIRKYLDQSSYYTCVNGVAGKSCVCWSNACIGRPFCRPRDTWTTESSPRFTRCMIVCRDTPKMRMASGMAT
jgi:retron-type reverse transcriptase